MKAHRRRIPRLTWFKLAVCICLAAMAASLFTPYPAQIIRALKGAPEQAPPDSGTCPPQKSPPAEQPGQEEQPITAAPSASGKEPGDERLYTPWTPERTIALPPVQYPPFPPVLPTRPAEGAMPHIYELARGLNLKTQVNFQPGTLASRDRETKSNYQMTLSLNVKQPKALTKKEDMLKLNPKLEPMLPGLSTLFRHARVSPYYGQIYVRKQTEIRKTWPPCSNFWTAIIITIRRRFWKPPIRTREGSFSGCKVKWMLFPTARTGTGWPPCRIKS